jgi:hypothetical protein
LCYPCHRACALEYIVCVPDNHLLPRASQKCWIICPTQACQNLRCLGNVRFPVNAPAYYKFQLINLDPV